MNAPIWLNVPISPDKFLQMAFFNNETEKEKWSERVRGRKSERDGERESPERA